MKDNMDELLKKALKPDMQPDPELNEKILSEKRTIEMKPRRFIPATVAAALALVVLCPIGVYAASKTIFKTKTTVKTDYISQGNQDYVPDDIATSDNATSTVTGHEEGTEDTNWISKEDIVLSNGVKNTRYRYDNYKLALEDAGFDDWFNADYEIAYNVTRTIVDMGSRYVPETSIDAGFKYKGYFFSIMMEEWTENNVDDMAFSIPMTNADNVRNYVNKQGIEYELVDSHPEENKTETHILIYNRDFVGDICFENMDDALIHEILDQTAISFHVPDIPVFGQLVSLHGYLFHHGSKPLL